MIDHHSPAHSTQCRISPSAQRPPAAMHLLVLRVPPIAL